jgi:hypothetical protein
MPLTGDAKTAYQREYMRRRRAEQQAGAKDAVSITDATPGSNSGLTRPSEPAEPDPIDPELLAQLKEAIAADDEPSRTDYSPQSLHDAADALLEMQYYFANDMELAQWLANENLPPMIDLIGQLSAYLKGVFARQEAAVRRNIDQALTATPKRKGRK